MPQVRMPDGVLVNFPDDMPNEQIKGMIASRFPEIGPSQDQGYTTENKGASDYARTIFDQGMQGATFGFADEASDRLGALGASFYTGLPYEDLLEEARSTTKDRLNEQLQEMPVTSIGANIAGGLATGLAGATTKAGAAIGNSLRSGNLSARAVKGALAGAASGAAYGAGTSENRLEGAGQGAILGGAVGAVAPVASATLSKLNTRTIVPNSDKIREVASGLYKTAEQKGGTLKPEFTNKFVDQIEKLKPQTDIGQIVGGDSPFTKIVEKVSQIRNRPMTLQAAQELDELLGDAIDDFTDMGRLTKQGKKLFDIQSTLRNMIDDADQSLMMGGKEGFNAWKEGKKLWATSHRLSDIERIIQRAEMTDNPATSIKTGFRTLYNNPNRIRGFSIPEKAAIKKAAESGVVSDLLRTAGSRLNPIIAGTTGGFGAAAAGAATSMAARGAATKVQVSKADKVARMIAESSDLVQQEKKIPQLIKLVSGKK